MTLPRLFTLGALAAAALTAQARDHDRVAPRRDRDRPHKLQPVYPKYETGYFKRFIEPKVNCGSCMGFYQTQWTSWNEACGLPEMVYETPKQGEVKPVDPQVPDPKPMDPQVPDPKPIDPKPPEVAPTPTPLPTPMPTPLPPKPVDPLPVPIEPKPIDPKPPQGAAAPRLIPATPVSIQVPDALYQPPPIPMPQSMPTPPPIPLVPTLPTVNIK